MKTPIPKNKIQHFLHKYHAAIIICPLISAIYYCLIHSKIETIFHYADDQLPQLYLYMFIGFCLLSTFLFTICYFFINRHSHRTFIKYFLIYFIIMCIFLVLGWPGIFRGDEYYTIPKVTNMDFAYEQHYFTNIFYAISLSIFPTLGGITFIQITIISVIVAYVLSHVEKNLKYPRLTYLLFVVLLLPPIIDANLFTLRSTLTAYLFLLAICHLVLYSKDHNPHRLFYLGILCCILANWKSEFICLPILIVAYLVLFYRKELQFKKFFSYLIIFAAIFFILRAPQQQNLPHYATTVVVNPLSVMLTYPEIESSLSDSDRDKIDKVIPIEELKKRSTYQNIDSFFSSAKDFSSAEEKEFIATFIKLVLKYPAAFLDAKFKTYAATNFPTPEERINHTGFEDPTSQWDLILVKNSYLKDNFPNTSNPFGEEFKKKFVSALQLRDDDYRVTTLSHIFYNTTIPILVSVALMLIAAFRKHWKLLCILAIELAQLPIIFLSAPANFWMYYFCLYLTLYFTIAYLAILYLDRRIIPRTKIPNMCYNKENKGV